MTEPDSRPRLSRKALLKYDNVRKMDMLLLPERVVKLNSTGAAILTLCDGSKTVNEIVQAIERQYDQDGLAADVLEFLRAAAERGWIEDG